MVRRSGFVVRSNERWWNIVVKDISTGEWFLLDQSLTHIEDAVGTLKEGNIAPLYDTPPVEGWMREDSPLEDCIPPGGREAIPLERVATEGIPVHELAGKDVTFDVADMIDWHGLDGDDEYSNYYRHVKEALDCGEG